MGYSSIEFFFSEVHKAIIRNPLMSFAAFSTVLVSVVVLGLFLIIIGNLNFITDVLLSQVEVTVFLEEGLSEEGIFQIKTTLQSYASVDSVHFVSREEALKILEEKLKGNIPVKENPLLNSLEVSVRDPEKISEIASKAEKLKGVHHVKYGKREYDKLRSFSSFINKVGSGFTILMIVITMLIVTNTIRLTIYARKQEIDIMQLVGATRWFIRWPFIMEGLVYGFFGSILAVIILFLSYRAFTAWVFRSLPFIPLIPSLSLYTALALLITGIVMGFIASLFSVSRFLKI